MTAQSVAAVPETAARDGADVPASAALMVPSARSTEAPRRNATASMSALAAGASKWFASVAGQTRQVTSRTAAQAIDSEMTTRVKAFTTQLSDGPIDSLPAKIAAAVVELMAADVALVTIAEPETGRHFVRAMRGGPAAALGVEIAPGAGVTGQALRDHRVVVVSATPLNPDGSPRPVNPSGPPLVVAAAPAIHKGRVVATLTVGRQDAARPYSAADLNALDMVASIVALALARGARSHEFEEGSARDPLTGLHTRAYLVEALEQLLAVRRRMTPAQRPPLALIMFDVDGLKQINETNGREMGDVVLRTAANAVRQRFRASDTVARFGPDSFLVVLNGASPDLAAEAAAQILRQVNATPFTGARGEAVTVTMSTVCARYRDGERLDSTIKAIEAALEAARASGPGGFAQI